MHKEPFHIAGSDASGIVWKVGKRSAPLEGGRRGGHPLQPVVRPVPRVQRPRSDGLLASRRSGATRPAGARSRSSPRCRRSSSCTSPSSSAGKRRRRTASPTSPRTACWSGARRSSRATTCWCGAPPAASASSRCRLQDPRRQPDRGGVVAGQGRHGRSRSAPTGVINRKRLRRSRGKPNETPEQTKKRMDETKRLGGEMRKLTGGKDPDVVFEHVGQETFPPSVFLCKRFGKIVICGATSGFNLDVRRALPVDAAEGDPRLALRQRLSGGARQRAGRSPARSSRCSTRCSTSPTRRWRTSS